MACRKTCASVSTNNDYKIKSNGKFELIKETNDPFHRFFDEQGRFLFTTSKAENKRLGVWEVKVSAELKQLFEAVIKVQKAMNHPRNRLEVEQMEYMLLLNGGDINDIDVMRGDGAINRMGEVSEIVSDELFERGNGRAFKYKYPEDFGLYIDSYKFVWGRSPWEDLKSWYGDLRYSGTQYWKKTKAVYRDGVKSLNNYGKKR